MPPPLLTTRLTTVFPKVSQFEQQLSAARLICLDGNIPVSTIDYVCALASKHDVHGKHGRRPLDESLMLFHCGCASRVVKHNVVVVCASVWYEPTDADKACKPFLSHAWKSLTYSSPNLAELCTMTRTLGIPTPDGKFVAQLFCFELTQSRKETQKWLFFFCRWCHQYCRAPSKRCWMLLWRSHAPCWNISIVLLWPSEPKGFWCVESTKQALSTCSQEGKRRYIQKNPERIII